MSVEFSDDINFRFIDAEYLLNPRERESIDKDVRNVIYAAAVAQKIFGTQPIPRGLKYHKVSFAVEPSAPVFSDDFIPESMDKILKEEKTIYLTGIHKDYFLSMVDIDASRNSTYHNTKIDTLHLREMAALVAEYKERVLWRGHDIKDANPGVIDGNVKGFITSTEIQTFYADGSGSNATGSAGDIPSGTASAVGELISEKFEPPFDTVMSPKLFAQAMLNKNSTTFETDLERIRALTDQNGSAVIRNIYISHHLLTSDDDGTASAWVFIAPRTRTGNNTGLVLESYPLWHYPITANRLGIQGKVLWMGGAAVLYPKAIALSSGIDVDG